MATGLSSETISIPKVTTPTTKTFTRYVRLIDGSSVKRADQELKVNGNHLAADGMTFLDKRRKGLARFMNAVVQHPVLSQETLVVMFLTVPTVGFLYIPP